MTHQKLQIQLPNCDKCKISDVFSSCIYLRLRFLPVLKIKSFLRFDRPSIFFEMFLLVIFENNPTDFPHLSLGNNPMDLTEKC